MEQKNKIKFYKNGEEFIKDNSLVLESNPLTLKFVKLNALSMKEIDFKNWMVKVEGKNSFLLGLCKYPFNLNLFGDKNLVKDLALFIKEHNLYFNRVLASKEVGEMFCKEYSSLVRGSYKTNFSMTILKCDKVKEYKKMPIELLKKEDIEEIIPLIYDAEFEMLHRNDESKDEIKEELIKTIDDPSYYLIKEEGKIVSFCKEVRRGEKDASISCVYTIPSKRGKGYCLNLVSYVSEKILKENKLPYLFVDNDNPISNHIYRKIGYCDVSETVEFEIIRDNNIKTLLLAGGCFWCMAKPYYEYDGVLNVYSGYAGGKEVLPSYEEVKHQLTSHRETVMIIYDKERISFEKLFEIYLQTVDPFDEGGQFIDRGRSYSLCVFTSNEEEKKYIKNRIDNIEKQFNKKVYINIEDECIFYKGEEYHQDFALKNPSLYEKEEIESGRKK